MPVAGLVEAATALAGAVGAAATALVRKHVSRNLCSQSRLGTR